MKAGSLTFTARCTVPVTAEIAGRDSLDAVDVTVGLDWDNAEWTIEREDAEGGK